MDKAFKKLHNKFTTKLDENSQARSFPVFSVYGYMCQFLPGLPKQELHICVISHHSVPRWFMDLWCIAHSSQTPDTYIQTSTFCLVPPFLHGFVWFLLKNQKNIRSLLKHLWQLTGLLEVRQLPPIHHARKESSSSRSQEMSQISWSHITQELCTHMLRNWGTSPGSQPAGSHPRTESKSPCSYLQVFPTRCSLWPLWNRPPETRLRTRSPSLNPV